MLAFPAPANVDGGGLGQQTAIDKIPCFSRQGVWLSTYFDSAPCSGIRKNSDSANRNSCEFRYKVRCGTTSRCCFKMAAGQGSCRLAGCAPRSQTGHHRHPCQSTKKRRPQKRALCRRLRLPRQPHTPPHWQSSVLRGVRGAMPRLIIEQGSPFRGQIQSWFP